MHTATYNARGNRPEVHWIPGGYRCHMARFKSSYLNIVECMGDYYIIKF